MRLLVLGGTGFLGPHFVRAALDRGHDVTLFNRGKRGNAPEGVEVILGDRAVPVGEPGGLSALAGREWDAVIDNCGYVPRIVRQSAELFAHTLGPDGRYLFVSSISVYEDASLPGADESAGVHHLPADEADSEEVMKHYGALKAACEKVVEHALPGRALCVRPGLIVGPLDPTDRFTYWPARMDRGGQVLAPSDGTDPVQLIDARDLAEWMLSAIEARLSGVFNVTGPERRLSVREMVEACRDAAGRDDITLRFVPWPALEAEGVAPWSDLPAWVPSTGDTAGLGSVDCSRALAAGLTFRPLLATARDTLAWWRSLPPERRASPKSGLTPQREAQLLAKMTPRVN